MRTPNRASERPQKIDMPPYPSLSTLPPLTLAKPKPRTSIEERSSVGSTLSTPNGKPSSSLNSAASEVRTSLKLMGICSSPTGLATELGHTLGSSTNSFAPLFETSDGPTAALPCLSPPLAADLTPPLVFSLGVTELMTIGLPTFFLPSTIFSELIPETPKRLQ